MSGPEAYGRFYWCVKVDKKISPTGEIYVHADEVRYHDNGTLEFVRRVEAKDGTIPQPAGDQLNLSIAPGKWTVVYTASVLDGSAVAVDHWEGEVVR